ncbi:MAG: 16S rRNA (guanine(527)-N(7))-methyltransferase RsmG [Eubacteriales bacterium]|nr:16S rRNA (guanine(527)-N(7))-methyltransferase RsmG [Clostridiales bacterium]HOQ14026.1 16S rRNA (guanine(527)-N(7))-methyltransferase RsmG [Bacillota bacterium]
MISPEDIISLLKQNGMIGMPYTDDPKKTASILARFAGYLVEENEKYNLTAITAPEDILLKHFADSLTAAYFIPQGGSVLDVGSGAGFPAVPLAAARSDASIMALDSSEKKTSFITASAELFGIGNLHAINARAEDVFRSSERGGREFRERFDMVVSRAVASIRILAELCSPFVRIGGVFLAMKGPNAMAEITEAENAITTTGLHLEKALPVTLVYNDLTALRTLVVYRKVSPCPATYPRRYPQIMKNPL